MAKKSHGKGTSFGRNSSTAPSTGSSIGKMKLTNPVTSKYGGSKGAKLGNPSSSMVQVGKFGSRGR